LGAAEILRGGWMQQDPRDESADQTMGSQSSLKSPNSKTATVTGTSSAGEV
jgi:hypothetical protein